MAPSDEAFQRLPKQVMEQLQRNKTKLTDLLLYHVLNGSVMSTQLKNEEVDPSLFAKHNLRFNIYDDGKVGLIVMEGALVVSCCMILNFTRMISALDVKYVSLFAERDF